jgi:hypothetical protein
MARAQVMGGKDVRVEIGREVILDKGPGGFITGINGETPSHLTYTVQPLESEETTGFLLCVEKRKWFVTHSLLENTITH